MTPMSLYLNLALLRTITSTRKKRTYDTEESYPIVESFKLKMSANQKAALSSSQCRHY
jgi:hypothetical protein